MTSPNSAGLSSRIAEALLASPSDAILAADREGIIRFWNPGAVRIFGFPAEKAIGQSLDMIIPETLRARHWQGWAHAVATGQSRYGAGELLSVPAISADGRRISVEFTIAMLWDDEGHVEGVVAVLRDVTARFEELRNLRRQLACSPPSSNVNA